MSEPSARLLIINRERNRFQANVAKKKKEEASFHTRAAICHVLLMCQAVGGGRDRGGWGGKTAPLGSCTTSRGGPQVLSLLPLWTGRCRERKEWSLGLTPLGPVSEQRESPIPSRCRW